MSSSAVVIIVEAASVRITASITLEAGATVAVMEALGNSFATPDAASALLGITVVDVISLESTNVNAPTPLPESSKDANPAFMPLWALWALLPLLLLLVAALVLLYRRHSRLSRDRANAFLSRDRANVDLQISVHVNRGLQRAFREALGKEHGSSVHQVQGEQAQSDDTSLMPDSPPFPSLSKGGVPPSLPAGPPSSKASTASRTTVEQEEVRNMSAVGGPREPKSWCSRWLPVVPLSSEETGRKVGWPPSLQPAKEPSGPPAPLRTKGRALKREAPPPPAPVPPAPARPVLPLKREVPPPPAPVPPAPVSIAGKWSALSKTERAKVIAGAHAPAPFPLTAGGRGRHQWHGM